MISATPKAASKIVSNLSRRGSGIGIRLGTTTTGCSGFAYVLEYVDTPLETDIIHESDGFSDVHRLSFEEWPYARRFIRVLRRSN
jgi:iron-sulfur cluster assembly protein